MIGILAACRDTDSYAKFCDEARAHRDVLVHSASIKDREKAVRSLLAAAPTDLRPDLRAVLNGMTAVSPPSSAPRVGTSTALPAAVDPSGQLAKLTAAADAANRVVGTLHAKCRVEIPALM